MPWGMSDAEFAAMQRGSLASQTTQVQQQPIPNNQFLGSLGTAVPVPKPAAVVPAPISYTPKPVPVPVTAKPLPLPVQTPTSLVNMTKPLAIPSPTTTPAFTPMPQPLSATPSTNTTLPSILNTKPAYTPVSTPSFTNTKPAYTPTTNTPIGTTTAIPMAKPMGTPVAPMTTVAPATPTNTNTNTNTNTSAIPAGWTFNGNNWTDPNGGVTFSGPGGATPPPPPPGGYTNGTTPTPTSTTPATTPTPTVGGGGTIDSTFYTPKSNSNYSGVNNTGTSNLLRQGGAMGLNNMSSFQGGVSAATPLRANQSALTTRGLGGVGQNKTEPTDADRTSLNTGSGNNPNYIYPATTGPNTAARGFRPMPRQQITIFQIQDYINKHPESAVVDPGYFAGDGSSPPPQTTDWRIDIPGLGSGIFSNSGGNNGRFTPDDQSGLPGGHYTRFYEIANDEANWNGTAGGNYNDNPAALQQVIQERSTSRSDRFMNSAAHFVDWAVPLGISVGTSMMGIPGAIGNAAGTAAGVSAGTMNTIGQGLTWANRARQGYNLYNMYQNQGGSNTRTPTRTNARTTSPLVRTTTGGKLRLGGGYGG